VLLDIVYPDTIQRQFFFKKIPNELKSRIREQEKKLLELAKAAQPDALGIPRATHYVELRGRVYLVEFCLGRERPVYTGKEPVQEIAVLNIEEITELNPIR
jgi:hypothetical protein